MLVIIVAAIFYTSLTNALPLTPGLDYLDPVLNQEYVQSHNGHYKYGYESPKIKAHEVRDSDGTSRGFYSYVDDQRKVQHVEYVAGDDGFKVVGDNGSPMVPNYTPEVEAARKAHLDAYLEAERRGLTQQEAAKNRQLSLSGTAKGHMDTLLTINIPLNSESQPLHNNIVKHRDFGNHKINPSSGKFLGSTYLNNLPNLAQTISTFGSMYLNNYTLPNLAQSISTLGSTYLNNNNLPNLAQTIRTTTSRPTEEYVSRNVDNKVYVLPTPTVHHYEKIWPLPPVKFRDLEVRVNGHDWHDPKSRTFPLPQLPQNFFGSQQTGIPVNIQNPFLNQLGSSPTNMQTVQNPVTEKPQFIFGLQPGNFPNPFKPVLQPGHFSNPLQSIFGQFFPTQASTAVSQPSSPDLTNTEPQNIYSETNMQAVQQSVVTEKPQAVLGTQQMILQPLNFPSSFSPPLNQFFPTPTISHPNVSGLTAHQQDLIAYQQGMRNVSNTNTERQNIIAEASNIIHSTYRPVTKVVVTKSNVEVEQNIAALAAKKAFDVFKNKYNLN